MCLAGCGCCSMLLAAAATYSHTACCGCFMTAVARPPELSTVLHPSQQSLAPNPVVLHAPACLCVVSPPLPCRRTVESELRMSLEDVFASVDPVPLATASIAQVGGGGGGGEFQRALMDGCVGELVVGCY